MRTLLDLWPVLLGMALVTYGTRAGGLWLVGMATATPRLARILQHLATGVLTALVISGLHSGDLVVCLAVAGAIVLMSRTGNMLAAIAGAAMIAAAVRALVRL